jgi:hypothetical protein
MMPAFVAPEAVAALRARTHPAIQALLLKEDLSAKTPTPHGREAAALVAEWSEYMAHEVDWLSAPDALEHGRDLEARLAALQGPRPTAADRAHNTGPHQVSVGSSFLRFVTPSDAADYKKQIDAIVRAVDRDVGQCSTLDDPTRLAWGDFRDSWVSFMNHEPGWLDAAAQMDRAEEFASQTHDWQVRLQARACGQSAPPIKQPEETSGQVLSTVKTGLVVAGVVAAAIVIRSALGK